MCPPTLPNIAPCAYCVSSWRSAPAHLCPPNLSDASSDTERLEPRLGRAGLGQGTKRAAHTDFVRRETYKSVYRGREQPLDSYNCRVILKRRTDDAYPVPCRVPAPWQCAM
eukprot:3468486-Rhodomonas_salina.1